MIIRATKELSGDHTLSLTTEDGNEILFRFLGPKVHIDAGNGINLAIFDRDELLDLMDAVTNMYEDHEDEGLAFSTDDRGIVEGVKDVNGNTGRGAALQRFANAFCLAHEGELDTYLYVRTPAALEAFARYIKEKADKWASIYKLSNDAPQHDREIDLYNALVLQQCLAKNPTDAGKAWHRVKQLELTSEAFIEFQNSRGDELKDDNAVESAIIKWMDGMSLDELAPQNQQELNWLINTTQSTMRDRHKGVSGSNT